MDKQHAVEEIERIRACLHELVDNRCDSLKNSILSNMETEHILPLASSADLLKGKKPAAVIFGCRSEIPFRTWKGAVKAILMDCYKDPSCHDQILSMRGKVFGQQRVLLADTPDGMDSALKIGDSIYFESKFDTASLLKVLMHRILDAVGYDYSDIMIRYR